MIKKYQILSFILFSIIFFMFLEGCDKFEGDQTIPSYIKVNSFKAITDYGIQGTANQDIVDVWVYVDDQMIGNYEIPAQIPVLATGLHQVKLYAGIKLNGISDTRAPYPFFNPVIYDDFNLIQDSLITVNPVTSYESNTEFVWMEDFEDPSLIIDRGSESDTSIYITEPADNPDAFLDENSHHSGVVYLDSQRNYVLLESNDGNGNGFQLTRGYHHFMEINFKTDVVVTIGVYVERTDYSVQKRSYLVLNTTDTWKKIYVNLTPLVNDIADADNYKIYFEAYYSGNTGTQRIFLDNIKLLSRPN